jgi:hypothetical protein
MFPLSQPPYQCRSPRVRLASNVPVVLRLSDGRQSRGELKVISLTGGLLCLPKPLAWGSHVKLMFLTQAGAVLGVAEMLSPDSWALQPFRFLALNDKDEHRLRAAIELSLGQSGVGRSARRDETRSNS